MNKWCKKTRDGSCPVPPCADCPVSRRNYLRPEESEQQKAEREFRQIQDREGPLTPEEVSERNEQEALAEASLDTIYSRVARGRGIKNPILNGDVARDRRALRDACRNARQIARRAHGRADAADALVSRLDPDDRHAYAAAIAIEVAARADEQAEQAEDLLPSGAWPHERLD